MIRWHTAELLNFRRISTQILHIFCLILFVVVSSILFNCSSNPRFTRSKVDAAETTPQKKNLPPKKAVSSAHKKDVPSKETSQAGHKKEIAIHKAYAPEMHIPSGPTRSPDKKQLGFEYYQKGKASYYANKFHGRKTASGERYNQNELTAAHPKLPFNSVVKVTNTRNNRSVIVRINDRGPFARGRIIDISRAAAEQLGMLHSGIAEVIVETKKM